MTKVMFSVCLFTGGGGYLYFQILPPDVLLSQVGGVPSSGVLNVQNFWSSWGGVPSGSNSGVTFGGGGGYLPVPNLVSLQVPLLVGGSQNIFFHNIFRGVPKKKMSAIIIGSGGRGVWM